MADDPKQLMSSQQDIVTLLIKERGINEGFWSIAVEFHFGAAMGAPQGLEPMPTAMISVGKIGIQPCDATLPAAVDASIANPKKKARAQRSPAAPT
jgi:hypothetical protein